MMNEFPYQDMLGLARYLVHKLGVRRHLREDCVQEALAAMWNVFSKGMVDEGQNWRGFMYRVALNAIVKYLERQENKHIIHGKAAPENFAEVTVDGSVNETELHEEAEYARKLLSHLCDSDRKVVVRYFFDGKNSIEIAKEMGVSPSAITARMRRALDMMYRRHLSLQR